MSDSRANTDQSSPRHQTEVNEQISAMKASMRRGRCTFPSVHFDGSMFAGEAAGDQQLSSRWRIKTRRILLSTGMRLTHESERFFALGHRRVYGERIRRLQVGNTGLKIQSCHAIYCKTLAYSTSSTEEKNLQRQNNFSQKQESITCRVSYLLHCEASQVVYPW